MNILGLDTSTRSTGYSIMKNNNLVDYGVIEPPKKADLLDRYIYIEQYIAKIIKKNKIEFIVIEDLAVTRNASTTKALAGLLYHLLIEFKKKELLVVTIRPSQWRKEIGIKGKTRSEQKAYTIDYVKIKYNIDVQDDEADAVCLAEYGTKLNIVEDI